MRLRGCQSSEEPTFSSSFYEVRKAKCGKMITFLSMKKLIVKSTLYLVTSVVKTFLSRNFCQKSMRANFRNFHTVHQVWKDGKKSSSFFLFCQADEKHDLLATNFSNQDSLLFKWDRVCNFFSVAKPVKSHVDKLRLFLFILRKTPSLYL